METTIEKAPAVSEGLKFLLGQSHNSLFTLLEEVVVDGGNEKLGIKEKITSLRREGDAAGFRYTSEGWIQGHLLISLLKQGGFSLNTSIADNGFITEKWDLYDEKGELTQTVFEAPETISAGEVLEMDLSCPILDYLYNMLAFEYEKAGSGVVRSIQVHAVERFLRSFYKDKNKERRRDPLIRHIFHKMLIIEADPVLNWDERQLVYDGLTEGLKRVLKVKRRAHGRGLVSQNFEMLRFRWASFARRFKARPLNNLQGLLYRFTIAKVIWFFTTVKSNLGYSVALAVYGPFTYYFITMPMNPHAMQAVGRVREAYLDMKSGFNSAMKSIEQSPSANAKVQTSVVSTTAMPQVQNAVQEAVSQTPITSTPMVNPNIIGNSLVTQGKNVLYPLTINNKSVAYAPKYLNLLLTSDVQAVDQINWNERMGNFKQMQIAYEESLEYAPRMGRLEQLETQYNFPMVVESAWLEMERYNNRIFKLRQKEANLSPKMKQFLTNEVNRTQQLELYLWDRLARFILDQPYVMLDEDQEQKRNDYYIGRSFVFMEEMSQVLGWRYPDFKRPHGYEKIEKAAKKYKSERKEQGNIMANLKANSDLFRQKDAFSTAEFRSYMKRQWEILFLQNAKAEEASNNGLNMYIWSVRNTVWCLQSMYSAKRQELELLVQKDVEGQLDGMDMAEMTKTELLQETLFHNLTLEWVGVKEEIGSRLAKDIETVQRRVVIENLKESLLDRSKLLNQLSTQAQASR
ncbi:MAG: hypothetical protein K2P81_05330 [Bacteriovoracaceae bacterium]|nr:hypothetical protein [Bacteriovoracaceae bacterium]